jgi:hypothetical protein
LAAEEEAGEARSLLSSIRLEKSAWFSLLAKLFFEALERQGESF